ncbi:transketolase, partial [bacterium]|nr:transketolase [bacterium]
ELAKSGIEVVVLDVYSVKPIDQVTINQLTHNCHNVIVVEDHYPAGGIGEAVLNCLTTNHQLQPTTYNFVHLCVHKLPRSGSPDELLHYEEIDAEAIINVVERFIAQK